MTKSYRLPFFTAGSCGATQKCAPFLFSLSLADPVQHHGHRQRCKVWRFPCFLTSYRLKKCRPAHFLHWPECRQVHGTKQRARDLHPDKTQLARQKTRQKAGSYPANVIPDFSCSRAFSIASDSVIIWFLSLIFTQKILSMYPLFFPLPWEPGNKKPPRGNAPRYAVGGVSIPKIAFLCLFQK